MASGKIPWKFILKFYTYTTVCINIIESALFVSPYNYVFRKKIHFQKTQS